MNAAPEDPVAAPTTHGGRAAFAESAGMAAIALGRMAQQIFEDELARIGLTMRHLGALGHLAKNPEMSISDLARRSGVTAQSMHATVRGLQQLEAVELKDLSRGRAAKLAVTPQGRELLGQARAATARLDERLAAELGDQQAHALVQALASIGQPPSRNNT